MTQTIVLTGLTCEACVKLINRKFLGISGVINTHITVDGHAHIETERTITKEEYSESLVGLPYHVVSVS